VKVSYCYSLNLEKTVFDVTLGANANIEEIAGNTIPAS
jgi:hypothetical protein